MDWRSTAGFKEQDFLFIYAGIMGYAQGLEIILHAANILRNHRDIHFILVGDGPLLNSLEELKRTLNLDNVHFYRNRPKREVLPMIESADAAIVPLRRLELFKGAIPSKIYETLAMGKPILLGVEGEAKELFIEEGKSGWAFVPEDSNDLSEIIKYLSKNREEMKIAGERGSDLVSKKFNLDTIIGDFMKKLESLNGN
ncbi:MAG TPA: glycosyltransferase family 4 protein [Bacteroidales bacterium]|nr:glycosyltransferase family 4 protein [Bacteroidales bacterium]